MLIDISVQGVREAVSTVTDLIVPWRRKNAKAVTRLENALRQAQIDQIKADTLIARVKVEREQAALHTDVSQSELLKSQAKKTEAEAALLLAEAEKKRAEAERERVSLRHAQIELAISIIDRWAGEIDGTQKMDFVIRLLPIVEQLSVTLSDASLTIPAPRE